MAKRGKGGRAECAIGDIVRIVFHDHVEDCDAPFLCEVFGRVSIVAPGHITVDTWTFADAAKRRDMDREQDRHNIKCFSIMREVIVRIGVIRGGDEEE